MELTIYPPAGFEAVEHSDAAPAARRRRGQPGPQQATDAVLDALEEQDLELVQSFDLVPTTAAGRRRRRDGRAPASAHGSLVAELARDEDAVVLIEQNGVYTWKFGVETPQRKTRAAGARVVAFDLSLHPDVPGRTRRRGPIKSFVIQKATAYVLRFVAKAVKQHALNALEAKVRTGIVHLESADVATWQVVEDPSTIQVPTDRPAHVLLLVHGTFSSTIGSYAGLSAGSGRELLKNAIENYDLVLGFDHRTLAVDPLENARELYNALRQIPWTQPPEIDAVAFSRGGLVLRSLTELVLPNESWRPSVARAVFVACTNGGTQLANPQNWKTLIDLYTTIAVAAAKAIALLPGAAAPSVIISGVIRSVGSFVQHLAAAVTAEKEGVPGLNAMLPEGAFVSNLNGTQPGQPAPNDTYYCAVTSDFDPKAPLIDGTAIELPPALLVWLGDGVVDKLMNEANDLVVNTQSMTSIDPHVGTFIRDRLDFGRNGSVFHCNYFYRPEVIDALARWLVLPGAAEPRRTSAFSLPSPLVNASVLVLPGGAPAAGVRRLLRRVAPDYVVMKRQYQGEVLYYAFSLSEVRQLVEYASAAATLFDVSQSHEYERSQTAGPTEILSPLPSAPSARTTVARTVIVHGDSVLGVLPSSNEIPTVRDLVLGFDLGFESLDDLRLETSDDLRFETLDEMRFETLDEMPSESIAESVDWTAPRPRRRSGGERSAPPAGAARGERAAPQPKKAELNFGAEIADQVVIDRDASIFVTISREEIAAIAAGHTGGRAGFEVDADKELIIQVVPRVGFELGDRVDRVTIPVPAPGQPAQLTFDILPVAEGSGEVWVQARQGPVPLATLKLITEIVQVLQGAERRLSATVAADRLSYVPTPVDVLRISEQSVGTETRLSYSVEFRTLGVQQRFESPALSSKLAEYVTARYTEIEERWAVNKNDQAAFDRDLRGIGATLFRELMPKELQRLLWTHRDQLKSVQVYSTEPYVPWEIVYVRDPDKKGGGTDGLFLGELGLVRWLYEGFPAPQLRARAKRVKYVIPRYELKDDVLEGAEGEAKWLVKELKAIELPAVAATVYREVSEPGRFDVLHFGCHGLAEVSDIAAARLKMAGHFSGDEYVEDYVLATTIENDANLVGPNDERPLIVVNACQTGRLGKQLSSIGGFAPAFIRGGAGAFVGANWSIGDDLAVTFVQTLYKALLDGSTLSEATTVARKAARDAADPTWLAYTVYGEPGARVAKV